MIIITLKGGLGNQMFQYACGRALSLRNGEPIKFDITGYKGAMNSDTPREYLLPKFNICQSEIANDNEIIALKNPYGFLSKLHRRIKTKLGFANIEFITGILKLKGDTLLNGYWQTEKYFIDHADTIRKEFTLKNPLSASAQIFADKIHNAKNVSATVSLHVRRGDVARDAWKNPYYGITTPEYYEKALKELTVRVGNSNKIHIFIFSDDIEWVKQNIKIPFQTTYISSNSSDKQIPDYEELTLMSMCDHNIIANSSFSWWGAWLNPNSSKIVIAPKQWIRKRQRQHKDICPESWIRLS